MSRSFHIPGGSGRILVVCTRYIGDTTLAIPFLRNLRAAFPSAVIDVCAEGGARAVLADCPYVDEFVAWRRPESRRGPAAALAAIRSQAAWLRSRGYDRAYLLKRSLSGALLAALAGIPNRIGFSADGRILLSRAVAVAHGRHQAARYLDLLRADGLPVDDGYNENWISSESAARLASVIGRLPSDRPRVFVAMRSTAPEKHWPADRWAEVIRSLVEERNAEVVLCGSPADMPEHRAVLHAVGDEVARHVHDLSHEVRLRDAGGLLATMDVCVGVDTGLIHLAASHGVPVAVLFGPTDPNQWSPWSPRAIVLRSARIRRPFLHRFAPPASVTRGWPAGEASLDDIPVADVLAAVESFLPPAVQSSRRAAAVRRLDLRTATFRYEIASSPAAGLPVALPMASRD
jgi:heptosyltransferase-2